MGIKIRNLDDLKNVYAQVKTRYKELLPAYREVYKRYYPEEFEKLKAMYDNGELPQYTYQDRCTSAFAIKRHPELFEGKEHYGDLPANWYDPINLRDGDPDFHDKFNYYGWEDFTNRPPLPHFDMNDDETSTIHKMADIVNFLQNYEWVVNNCKGYRSIGFGATCEYDVSEELTRFISSRAVHYEHEDIVITDPCYVMRHDDDITDDDWDACNYGSAMENLGNFFTADKYATGDTLYGDWGCTTYNRDTSEKIGSFCADAGLVSVFSLAQIHAYNPDYDPTERDWCATLIRDFTGDVTLAVGFDEKNVEFIRYVEGEGSINFISSQTSL